VAGAGPLAQDEAGVLSAAEERFDRWRRTLGLFLGPTVGLVLYLLPTPTLSQRAHTLAAIIGLVIVFWVTEAVPLAVTALLGPLLCVITGVAGVKDAFASFADPVIFVFLGSFVLAEAMAVHGLDRRFALAILGQRAVGGSTTRLLFAYGAIAAILSMWISNTATTAMMLPIGLGIVTTVSALTPDQSAQRSGTARSSFGTGMMLMVAYAASVGGIATPVGTPPNLIGIALIERHVGVRIPFFQWMAFAVPLMVLMYLVLFALILVIHRPEVTSLGGSGDFVRRERLSLGPWTAGQRNALLAFLVVVSLWLAPGFLAVFSGATSAASKAYGARMPEGVAALVGVLLLFLLPVSWERREFTLNWKQAVRIDWGTLLLFGGGLTLGTLMFETKLAEVVGRDLLRLSGATSPWSITLASIFIAIVVSEATSNTASANMVVPAMIALSLAAGVNPLPPALGATLGASWGFMLPISTPPNAIAYGSGLIPITKMIKTGVVFDLLGGLLLWAGLRVLLPVLGLA
jgi:solute carrier family 13 (sodium-dependent dicarboxylate transporter), member 2/3/5